MRNKEKYRFQVGFDVDSYFKDPGVPPKAEINTYPTIEESNHIVKDYFNEKWRNHVREPIGNLKFPFIVPGSVYDQLWDWDSFFIGCALPDEGLEFAKGSVLNLVTNINEQGCPPKLVQGTGKLQFGHPYPIHAQFAYIVAKRMGDFSWIEQIWDNLMKIVRWYEQETMVENRFVWVAQSGIDNNPSVYGRTKKTSAGIDLACWHYREYKAYEKLSSVLNKNEENRFREKAECLKNQIQTDFWDVMDDFFYNIDCSVNNRVCSMQEVKWNSYLKFRNWASLFPMWAKAASDEQVKILRQVIMSPDEFLSCCGIRSHSAIEPVYNNVPMGNPSNWQGPVWGLSTFVTGYALAKYGYKEDAIEVCSRLIRTYAADILKNGCVHEFYHGDTGQPLIKPGFMSWNLLALHVLENINEGKDCTSLDVLD
ncbi:MGH1-like glycoside hydrolase domain-containing protein [Paenibacillus ferrarius]|uniref:MGH1-like glycoside hydrolase domain-containing protein n=1 Tax=Paenibacillus ferrarius TaxID=1469647 RepID=UPI003D2B17DF